MAEEHILVIQRIGMCGIDECRRDHVDFSGDSERRRIAGTGYSRRDASVSLPEIGLRAAEHASEGIEEYVDRTIAHHLRQIRIAQIVQIVDCLWSGLH
jgi:hypothetical protein